jgi:hypothetical protein
MGMWAATAYLPRSAVIERQPMAAEAAVAGL